MLLSIEQGSAACGRLQVVCLLRTQTPMGIFDQWPETLVADGSSKQAHWPAVQELVSLPACASLFVASKTSVSEHTHIAAHCRGAATAEFDGL